MIVTNFGDNLDAGRPPKTPAQLAAERLLARAHLARCDAMDLAEMLGLGGAA